MKKLAKLRNNLCIEITSSLAQFSCRSRDSSVPSSTFCNSANFIGSNISISYRLMPISPELTNHSWNDLQLEETFFPWPLFLRAFPFLPRDVKKYFVGTHTYKFLHSTHSPLHFSTETETRRVSVSVFANRSAR